MEKEGTGFGAQSGVDSAIQFRDGAVGIRVQTDFL